MSVIENLQKGQEPITKVQEAAKAMNEFVEKIDKLAKEGEELSELQKTFKGVEMFGKLSTGLAVASMGLDVALYFFGPEAPDPNAEVLKAISALDQKVTGLWADMSNEFTQVEAHIDLATATILTKPILNNFYQLHFEFALFVNSKGQEGNTNLVSYIYDPAKLISDFHAIKSSLTSTAPYENPLLATYNATHGDARTIIQLGKTFLGLCFFVPMAYSLTAALRYSIDPQNKKNKIQTPKEVDDHFNEDIKAIRKAVNDIIDRCEKEVNQNIILDMKKSWTTDLSTDYQEASSHLLNKFSTKYYWLDCAITVGDILWNDGQIFILEYPENASWYTWKGANKAGKRFLVHFNWQLKSNPTFHSILRKNPAISKNFEIALENYSKSVYSKEILAIMTITSTNHRLLSANNLMKQWWVDPYLNIFKKMSIIKAHVMISTPFESLPWGQSWSNSERIVKSLATHDYERAVDDANKGGTLSFKSRCYFLSFY